VDTGLSAACWEHCTACNFPTDVPGTAAKHMESCAKASAVLGLMVVESSAMEPDELVENSTAGCLDGFVEHSPVVKADIPVENSSAVESDEFVENSSADEPDGFATNSSAVEPDSSFEVLESNSQILLKWAPQSCS
jgi:hypothetical protein